MIHNLKPYPKYKDSGVLWLREVPEHWDVLPSRALFDEVKEKDCADEQLLSVTISKGVIRQSDLLTNSSKKDSSNEDKTNYKLVRPGDITYNKMRAWQGAVGVSKYRGIVSPAYVVVHPREKQNANYFHYLFRTPAFAKEAERWSYGITSDQWSLRPEHFKMIYCSLPPEDEQSSIVIYLDQIDRRIRRYIRTKQKLIKLLEEQKQAIIHQAVTRGLDPNVKLKSSGVEWLGDVPEHWDVVALRRYWEVVDCKHVTVPFVDEGIPLASVREVQSFDLNLSTSKRTNEEWYAHLISGGRRPQKGDLIYCRNVSVGACAFVTSDETFAMGQDVCLIRSETENGRFLNYFMRSPAMQQQLSLVLIGSTFNRINVSEIKSLLIAVPPRNEQDSIVSSLDANLSKLNKPIELAQKEISLLREYRTHLIADVVTGKLDVREAAANLPEETDKTETFDDSLSEDDELESNEIENSQAGELEEEILA
ncbi:restriction endonuclease subunit S [Methanosarcina sp.]|uniref:restriction endonuclease subunit S n=1 Tax=Methanosarcina sp. TaxID=2213 RepID=UPI003C76665E